MIVSDDILGHSKCSAEFAQHKNFLKISNFGGGGGDWNKNVLWKKNLQKIDNREWEGGGEDLLGPGE